MNNDELLSNISVNVNHRYEKNVDNWWEWCLNWLPDCSLVGNWIWVIERMLRNSTELSRFGLVGGGLGDTKNCGSIGNIPLFGS